MMKRAMVFALPHRGWRAIDRKLLPAMPESLKTDRLLRLLAEHQPELFRYVFSLLPHEEDAKDVLQETFVALTHKFDEYDPEKPFLAWAYGFAYMQVLKHRERSERSRRILSDDVVGLLASERQHDPSAWSEQLQALDGCLEKLSAADRRLVAHRYLARTTADQLSTIVGSSRRTLFRNLERIRRLLHDCITRQVEETGG
jgi:RNA polymerase sigma-70 factor (ECF subfamily)